jgi:hypothetical protein
MEFRRYSGHSFNLSPPFQAVRGKMSDIIIIDSFPFGEGKVSGFKLHERGIVTCG